MIPIKLIKRTCFCIMMSLQVLALNLIPLETSATPLKDDEVCEAGKDCTCGNVTCNLGTKCEMTGPTGICSGPLAPIETVAIDEPSDDKGPVVIGGLVIAVIAISYFILTRRKKKTS